MLIAALRVLHGAPRLPQASSPAGRDTALLGDTLCCLAIPADMSVAEFCTFCGAYLSCIREMRVLRREAVSRRVVCMVLVRFDNAASASSFLLDCNNKPFCSLEPEILCRLVRVRSVEILERPAVGADECHMLPAPLVTNPRSGGGGGGADAVSGSERGAAAAAAASPSPTRSGGGGCCLEAAVPASASAAACPLAHRSPHRERPLRPHAGASSSSSPAAGVGMAPAAARAVPPLPPPAGTTELPTCPVCLERLDHHISGVVTTVCNHRFHSECLQARPMWLGGGA